jgi:hypothetical protein
VTMVERRRRVAGGGWRIGDRNGRGALKLLLSCFFLAPWETNGFGEGGQGARASSGNIFFLRGPWEMERSRTVRPGAQRRDGPEGSRKFGLELSMVVLRLGLISLRLLVGSWQVHRPSPPHTAAPAQHCCSLQHSSSTRSSTLADAAGDKDALSFWTCATVQLCR